MLLEPGRSAWRVPGTEQRPCRGLTSSLRARTKRPALPDSGAPNFPSRSWPQSGSQENFCDPSDPNCPQTAPWPPSGSQENFCEPSDPNCPPPSSEPERLPNRGTPDQLGPGVPPPNQQQPDLLSESLLNTSSVPLDGTASASSTYNPTWPGPSVNALEAGRNPYAAPGMGSPRSGNYPETTSRDARRRSRVT